MGIDLDLITTATSEDNKYRISGIPDKLWEIFTRHAKEIMPEKGNNAWASLLTEMIQSHIEGNWYSFIMTEIPLEARDALAKVCNDAGLSSDALIGLLFKRAMDENLHVMNMVRTEDPEAERKTMVITGIDSKDWNNVGKTCQQAELTIDEIFRIIFRRSNRLRILNMIDTDDPEIAISDGETILLTGIPAVGWEKFRQVAQEINMFPEELLGHILAGLAQGGKVTLTPVSEDNNAKAQPEYKIPKTRPSRRS